MSQRALAVLLLVGMCALFVGGLFVADVAGVEGTARTRIDGKCVVLEHRSVLRDRLLRSERTC